jgi:hypothetical protein
MNFITALSSLLSEQIITTIRDLVIPVMPMLLAYILFKLFWPLWVNYVRSDTFSRRKYSVLEVKLPRESFRSPAAMELFLNSLHNTSDGNFFAQYWKGEKRPGYSLEIISVEGVVKFMIYTEDQRKNGVMATLYSQFPGIEVIEVPDYTRGIHFDPKESKMYAAEFIFTKEDSNKNLEHVYPIKTYIDYGLDKDPKEEFKVDPMTPMIEFLGSIGPNQQVWFQYIIRAHIKEVQGTHMYFKKTDPYKDQAKKVINEMMGRDPKTKIAGVKDKVSGRITPPTLSDGEKEIIKAIERNMAKPAFDVGIRVIYIAKKSVFDKPNGIGGIVGSFKHFSTENFNGIKPNGDKYSARFSGVPWQDYKNLRENKQLRNALEAYKRRSFFYDPVKSKHVIMSTEELATIYHFPGGVAATPGLTRIPSKKYEAPSNLPI